jgi:guanylate kinase
MSEGRASVRGEAGAGGPTGDLFIVSAPSGAGKTTLIRRIVGGAHGCLEGLYFAVSHTTRPPRPGEVEGRDYHYVEVASFDKMVAEGRFLEWANVHGNRYGTSLGEVLPRLLEGRDVLLDIDVQGAARILADAGRGLPAGTGLHSIFILPPSFAALRQRLNQRGGAEPRDLERRLDQAHREIAQVDRYDYVIVNDDAEAAARVLSAIILDKRYRRTRVAPVLRSLLVELAHPGAAGRAEE